MVRPTLPATLLVFLLLGAGCLQSSQPAGAGPGGNSQGGLVEVTQDGGPGEQHTYQLVNGTGAVTGAVYDDKGTPVPSASVSLLKTDKSARTNGTGHFELLNVTAGVFTLRVDQPGFHALEQAVTIRENQITKVEITIVPLQDVGAGYRPHLHDYWADRKEVIVMDHDDYFHPQGAGFSQVYNPATQAAGVNPCIWTKERDNVYFNNKQLFLDDPFQLIWVGTSKLVVTVTWGSSDYTGSDVAMAWKPANSSLQYIQGPLFKNGAAFTLPVEPPEWDASHQGFTLWEFWLCVNTNGNEQSGTAETKAFIGKFHIKMTMVRGYPIPVEQAHPNFWENGTERLLVPTTTNAFATTKYNYQDRSTGTAGFYILPGTGLIAPPGTGVLKAVLTWKYAGPVNQNPWSLTYRPGNVNPRVSTDPGSLTKPAATEKGATSRTYLIKVDPQQTDAFYQKKSNWLFFLSYEGQESSKDWFNTSGGQIDVTLNVTASKDPTYV